MKKMNFFKKAGAMAVFASSALFPNKLLAQEPKMPSDLSKIQSIGLNSWGAKTENYLNDTSRFVNPDNNLPGSFVIEGAVKKNKDKWSLEISSIAYSQDYRFFYSNQDANIISLYGGKNENNAIKMKITSVNSDYNTVEMQALDTMSKIHRAIFRHGWQIDDVWNNNSAKNHDFADWVALVENMKIELIDGKTAKRFTLSFKREFSAPFVLKLLDSTESGRILLPVSSTYFLIPEINAEWILKLTAENDYKINLATTILPGPVYTYADTVIAHALVGRIEKRGGFGERAKVADPDFNFTELFYDDELKKQVYPFDSVNGMHGKDYSYPSEFVFGMSDDFRAYKTLNNTLVKDSSFHRFIPHESRYASNWVLTSGWEKRFIYGTPDTVSVAIKNSITGTTYDSGYGTTIWQNDHIASLNKISPSTFKFERVLSRVYKRGSAIDTTHEERLKQYFTFKKNQNTNKYVIEDNMFEYERNYYSAFRKKDEKGDWWANTGYKNIGRGPMNDMFDADSIRVRIVDSTTIAISYNELLNLAIASKAYEIAIPFKALSLIAPEDELYFYNQDSIHFRWSSAPENFKYRFYLSRYEDMYDPIIDSLLNDTTLVLKKPEQEIGSGIKYYWKIAAEHNDGGKVDSPVWSFIAKDTLTVGVDENINEKFNVFPNPVSGLSTIEFPESPINQELNIYDCNGNCVMNIPINAGQTTSHFDTAVFPTGIYDVYVGKKHARLVIMR